MFRGLYRDNLSTFSMYNAVYRFSENSQLISINRASWLYTIVKQTLIRFVNNYRKYNQIIKDIKIKQTKYQIRQII